VRPEGAGSKRRLEWSGKTVVARAETSRGHARIADTLKTMRAYGFRQVAIEARFVTGPAKVVEALNVSWKLMPTEVAAAETPEGALRPVPSPTQPAFPEGDGGANRARAEVVVQKNLPVTLAVLDESQMKTVLEQLQSDRRSKLLQAPAVTVFSGQSAVVCNATQSAFAVGLIDRTPQIRVISEGTTLRLRPLLAEGDSLRLDYELSISEIRGVETASVPGGLNGQPAAVHVPEVDTTRVEGCVKFPAGQALLIGGLQSKDAERPSMLVMLRAAIVEPARALWDPQLSTKAYAVADLVVPFPGLAVSPDRAENNEESVQSHADFNPLIDLITSTVAPASWQKVGGCGTITAVEGNLSLVVSQTAEVHKEIAELLEQLRRTHDLQITFDVKTVRVPEEMLQRIGVDLGPDGDHAILGPREARLFQAFAAGSKEGEVRSYPAITCFNGQMASVSVRPGGQEPSQGYDLWLMPVVANDRRSVRLTAALFKADEAEGQSSVRPTAAAKKVPTKAAGEAGSVAVPDGHILLVDVTGRWPSTDREVGEPIAPGSKHFRRVIPEGASNRKTFLMVTPRIVVSEEEEARVAASPG
jgi:hypothetical protein